MVFQWVPYVMLIFIQLNIIVLHIIRTMNIHFYMNSEYPFEYPFEYTFGYLLSSYIKYHINFVYIDLRM